MRRKGWIGEEVQEKGRTASEKQEGTKMKQPPAASHHTDEAPATWGKKQTSEWRNWRGLR